MPKSKSNYPEIDHIREDLNSLRSNVVELTKHIQKNGSQQSRELSKQLQAHLADLQVSGREQLKGMEERVKRKPLQALGFAFAGGILASYLMSSRR